MAKQSQPKRLTFQSNKSTLKEFYMGVGGLESSPPETFRTFLYAK